MHLFIWHLKVVGNTIISKFWSEWGDFNFCGYWYSKVLWWYGCWLGFLTLICISLGHAVYKSRSVELI